MVLAVLAMGFGLAAPKVHAQSVGDYSNYSNCGCDSTNGGYGYDAPNIQSAGDIMGAAFSNTDTSTVPSWFIQGMSDTGTSYSPTSYYGTGSDNNNYYNDQQPYYNDSSEYPDYYSQQEQYYPDYSDQDQGYDNYDGCVYTNPTVQSAQSFWQN